MMCGLLYEAGVRACFTRDPFHRCWNDCKLALQSTGLWWAVLLARVVFNLPYGPWDGSAWFEDLQTSAADAMHLIPPAGPVWAHVYPLVCQDLNRPAQGALQRKQEVLELALATAVERKGRIWRATGGSASTPAQWTTC
eukprot:2085921-Lingulodinium_polyedra.AAC.1